MSRSRRVHEERPNAATERLAELQREFDAFRVSTPDLNRRRFPQELRRKALAALDEGIPLKVVMAACKITTTHIERWQVRRDRPRSAIRGPAALPQVLNVVQDHPKEVSGQAIEGIEIRIGRWQLQLRLEQASSCRG